MKLEVILTNVVTLAFSIMGFYFFGLVGLGYAVVAENILALIVYLAVKPSDLRVLLQRCGEIRVWIGNIDDGSMSCRFSVDRQLDRVCGYLRIFSMLCISRYKTNQDPDA